jgi:Stage II sporulation protein
MWTFRRQALFGKWESNAVTIVIGPEPLELPERVYTVAGWMSLDDEYIPRVIAGENLRALFEAKAALAIAARTYLLRAMRDRRTLGKTTPISNGEKFQVFANVPTDECIRASLNTRGIVLRYNGRLVLANHVAGALWNPDGSLGQDPTKTERFVTYNVGRSGNAVIPTPLALRTHPGNRGCFGQNSSHWLAAQGYDHRAILRFFYGEDIEFHELGKTDTGTSATKPALAGIVALAALGMMIGRR